jgi:hypothetical protein
MPESPLFPLRGDGGGFGVMRTARGRLNIPEAGFRRPLPFAPRCFFFALFDKTALFGLKQRLPPDFGRAL